MLTGEPRPVPNAEGGHARVQTVPADTSPTWELELLISGAVLFSLFKAPGAVAELFDRMRPQVAGAWDTALFMSYYYVKSAVYALVAIFIVHLVARSYWVGIVGLHTVFPRGVRWDRFGSGPNVRRVYEERTPTLSAIAARTDNFCSTLFSFGFLIVLVFVVSLAISSGRSFH